MGTGDDPAEAKLSEVEVVEILAADFPQISVAQLRFLSDMGVVTPERDEDGNRSYGVRDLHRLRYIFEHQQSELLPLAVLRLIVEQSHRMGWELLAVDPPPGLTVGEVLEQLEAEFPEITVSKVRYLEDLGLVTPQIDLRGRRRFSPDAVRRLRFIFTAQLHGVDLGSVAVLLATSVDQMVTGIKTPSGTWQLTWSPFTDAGTDDQNS